MLNLSKKHAEKVTWDLRMGKHDGSLVSLLIMRSQWVLVEAQIYPIPQHAFFFWNETDRRASDCI